ncbi:hypothetical protein V6N11_039315 [Hibiscus sabdariffa]|uniref:Uncharacterized protein n=1 Tax=Hibiscus sabdariffa TaxID=183260 RepID=A0ABR2SMV8_9ROSI
MHAGPSHLEVARWTLAAAACFHVNTGMQVRQKLVTFMHGKQELATSRWTPAQMVLLLGSSQPSQLPNQFPHRPGHLEVARGHWLFLKPLFMMFYVLPRFF